jgi:hypothetical protein
MRKERKREVCSGKFCNLRVIIGAHELEGVDGANL